ncbi:TolC family protein [Gimesia sp.]|uniref:TolC family protein n=1 Tax=Gimesia sp. TaxID=2024833 RepID=UPI0025BCF137|nr:TolC family protein [Gimesia sp.]
MQFRPEIPHSPVNVNTLIQEALMNSAQIRVINDDPIIAETAITQAMSEFDPKLFLESKFNRISVPASSTLDTGTDFSRLRENDWSTNIGIRRKHIQGGQIELAQQFGMNTSNSIFFVPPNQGDARLTLSFNQPLLNGRGQAYNESLIVLAELNTGIASDRTQAALQDHLLDVTETYWELYLNRVIFLQKRKHLQDGRQIQTYLEKRYNLDSLQSQIARARAAVARRESEVIRAEAAVQNSETRLRSLVNSPQLGSSTHLELISIQQPNDLRIPVTVEDAMATAMEYRSEVDIASQEIQAARVRLGVACNDLLPKLDLVLETYLTGLKGDFNISQAWVDQFSVGEPSYTAGFVFEVPLWRQQAKSQHLQRTVELRRLLNKFELTVDNLRAEVETAVRYVETADRNLRSQYHSLQAANADAEYLKRRWEMLPGHDRSSSFLLEDLIDAQDRRAEAEQAFVTAQVDHVMSLTKLNRSTGTILRQEHVDMPFETDPLLEVPVSDEYSEPQAPSQAVDPSLLGETNS